MEDQSEIKLTRREQRDVYEAVSERMHGYWERRDNSVLHLLHEGFMMQHNLIVHHATPRQMKERRHVKEFKEEYNKVKNEIISLKRRKLIQISRTAEGLLLKLTGACSETFLRQVIENESNTYEFGSFCYVFFDIPEDVREVRDDFRRLLKCSKFTMIQRSVWRTNRRVGEYLKQLIKGKGVERWITIMEGSILN